MSSPQKRSYTDEETTLGNLDSTDKASRKTEEVVLLKRKVARKFNQVSVTCEWRNRPDGVVAAVYKDGFFPDTEAVQYVTMPVTLEPAKLQYGRKDCDGGESSSHPPGISTHVDGIHSPPEDIWQDELQGGKWVV